MMYRVNCSIRQTFNYLLAILMAAVIAHLCAADANWMTKRIADWNDQDARQVLTNSPWVKIVAATLLPGLSAYQRREGGDMRAEGGGRDGLGFDPSVTGGVVPMLTGINAPKKEDLSGHAPKIEIRWESALPIRAAELKMKDNGAPELEGEDYAIAIYNVPLKSARVEMKGLPEMLKKCAYLKIEGKKEIKPVRVAVMELGEGMATVVYFFPRSSRLSLDDKRIEFDAQIGRVALAQYFYTADMKFDGKLEL
jgi:hypothetical protein